MAKRREGDDSTPEFPRSSFLPGQGAPDPDAPGGVPPPADPPAAASIEPPAAPAARVRTGSLADHLERTRRHPVIVFGVGASGKTTMLMSLVQALNRSNSVNIYLGDPIFPSDHPDAVEVHERAVTFFERDAQAFALGELVPATRFENPYFIPVDIERKSDGRLVRLALLEGRGEWYEPIKQGRGTMFPKFQEGLAEVMELYGESLSVLWVAPYSIGDGRDEDTEDSDLALLGALNEYRKRRSSISQDFHLFLLTKWDCFAEPLADKANFSVVSAGAVEAKIEERYPNVWPNYQGLALNTVGRRFFMQYASGHIVKNRVRVPPKRHRAAFDRYPRTILNWLYGNATQTEVDVDGHRARLILFPDVMPQPVRPIGLLERIRRFLLAS